MRHVPRARVARECQGMYQRKRTRWRRSCTLPAGHVGATRWVARRVRGMRDRGVGLYGTIVHDGARATHRVAPTWRAHSRVRCSKEHRGHPVAHVGRGGWRTAPHLGHGGAVPLQDTETCVVQTIVHPTSGRCRGDPVGRPLGAAHAGSRRRVAWARRARWRQGDAPRRPYMPCVQPRAL